MRPKLPHEILQTIIDSMAFPVEFKAAVDNGDDTITLSGICDLHHSQPGAEVIIGSDTFTIKDYEPDGNKWKLILYKGTNSLPSVPGSFNLSVPLFVHGTPMQQEAELTKIPLDVKTPLIYLMEPYISEYDNDLSSSIGYRSDIQLCFLTQAEIQKWLTDDFYHNAITPMKNLMEDLLKALKNSHLFFDVALKTRPKFHTKFGINIRDLGTKKLYFSENMSGVSVDFKMEIYKEESCVCCD